MYIFGTSYRLKSKAIALLFSFLVIIAATTTRICAQGPIGMDAMQETPQIEWRGAVVAQDDGAVAQMLVVAHSVDDGVHTVVLPVERILVRYTWN